MDDTPGISTYSYEDGSGVRGPRQSAPTEPTFTYTSESTVSGTSATQPGAAKGPISHRSAPAKTWDELAEVTTYMYDPVGKLVSVLSSLGVKTFSYE